MNSLSLSRIHDQYTIFIMNSLLSIVLKHYKVECVLPMVAISLLPHAEIGRNDHREDALPFSFYTYAVTIFQGNMSDLLFYLIMTL